MNIVVLCVSSLVLTFLAWIYLNFQSSSQLTVFGEYNETLSEPDELERKKAHAFSKPCATRVIFLMIMLAVLCGISVSLTLIFPANSLVHNIKLICLLGILFVAANVDFRQQIIPNFLILFGLALRTVFWIVELINSYTNFIKIFKNNLVACLIVVLFFVVGVLLVKSGIGMGDIKLMLIMCLFQGFYGVVSSLFCSLFVAFIYAVVVLILKKKTKKDSVAFAPAILIGTVASVFLTGI